MLKYKKTPQSWEWFSRREILEGKKYDYKVDVWSYGIVMIEFAQGDRPNRTKDQIKNWPPPNIGSTQWSDEYKNFVQKCLVKDPLKRSSMEELLDHEFVKDGDNYKQEFIQTAKSF